MNTINNFPALGKKANFQYIEIYTWLGGCRKENKKQNLKRFRFLLFS